MSTRPGREDTSPKGYPGRGDRFMGLIMVLEKFKSQPDDYQQ